MTMPDRLTSEAHDQNLSRAFDGQAAKFERAPVQSDPNALDRLVRFADLPADSLVFDAGCGPGLVAEAFLKADLRVFGVDLSQEMVASARKRCESFGDRARFEQGSIFDAFPLGAFDASISRYVIHHVPDPLAFVARQAELVRVGGIVIACDHTTDPDPKARDWHTDIERARDATHTRNLTPGELVDLFARAGLDEVATVEEAFTLDFDEWFDRGTPAESKENVRARLISGTQARGYTVIRRGDGGLTIECRRSLVRGVVPSVRRPSDAE
jgi:SAM-dependent methyltransferase